MWVKLVDEIIKYKENISKNVFDWILSRYYHQKPLCQSQPRRHNKPHEKLPYGWERTVSSLEGLKAPDLKNTPLVNLWTILI